MLTSPSSTTTTVRRESREIETQNAAPRPDIVLYLSSTEIETQLCRRLDTILYRVLGPDFKRLSAGAILIGFGCQICQKRRMPRQATLLQSKIIKQRCHIFFYNIKIFYENTFLLIIKISFIYLSDFS